MPTTEPYPTQPNLGDRLSALESRLEKLERGSSGASTTVLYGPTGEVLMRAGTNPADGKRGFTVGRTVGSPALVVDKEDGAESETLRIYDRNGNVLLADSPNYANGLLKPSLSHYFVLGGATAPSGTYTAETTVMESYFRKSNPLMEVIMYLTATATSQLQVRFYEGDTGLQFSTPDDPDYEPIYNLTTTQIRVRSGPLVMDPALPLGADVHLVMRVQRISGTGTCTVQTVSVRGADE